jgi:hypothetical protein
MKNLFKQSNEISKTFHESDQYESDQYESDHYEPDHYESKQYESNRFNSTRNYDDLQVYQMTSPTKIRAVQNWFKRLAKNLIRRSSLDSSRSCSTIKTAYRALSLVLATGLVLTSAPLNLVEAKTGQAIDIGRPVFRNTEQLDDVYNLSSSDYTADSMFEAIYNADQAANLSAEIDSYYMDRILARPGVADGAAGSNGNDDANTFLTRGRALYMYTSNPSVIGFGGNPAYHQPLGGSRMYRVTFSQGGSTVSTSEQTSARINYPSHWVGTYNIGSTGVTADVSKFISHQNVAVTLMTLTNTSDTAVELTLGLESSYVSRRSTVELDGGDSQEELVGTVSSPSNLTTITTRMTGDGFAYVDGSNSSLSRTVSVPAGESLDINTAMAFTTVEIPESTEDYVRFASMDNETALNTQKAEYNEWWHENIPYIDVPNKAIQKAIDYRWWLERYNSLDANIPGYDYQYPITIEGVLGYNNAIILTQPMHLQDVKWMRTPYQAYGTLLSAGNSSQSSAFLDNPGNRGNWNNHYGQYLATAGLETYLVKGGNEQLINTLAYYFEHDAKGQLDHYGNHTSDSTEQNY